MKSGRDQRPAGRWTHSPTKDPRGPMKAGRALGSARRRGSCSRGARKQDKPRPRPEPQPILPHPRQQPLSPARRPEPLRGSPGAPSPPTAAARGQGSGVGRPRTRRALTTAPDAAAGLRGRERGGPGGRGARKEAPSRGRVPGPPRAPSGREDRRNSAPCSRGFRGGGGVGCRGRAGGPESAECSDESQLPSSLLSAPAPRSRPSSRSLARRRRRMPSARRFSRSRGTSPRARTRPQPHTGCVCHPRARAAPGGAWGRSAGACLALLARSSSRAAGSVACGWGVGVGHGCWGPLDPRHGPGRRR